MKRVFQDEQVELSGFNNLTKALSFNLYDFCVGRNQVERDAYIAYIAKKFSAERITEIQKGICEIIEAEVLAVSEQNYVPYGASSMVLMSDLKGGLGPTAMHLDKSHICAHSYPDISGDVCSIRIDIDIATCGEISPLSALNYMFDQFDADVVVIDYVVRGFTRDQLGRRIYRDHEVSSIQKFIRPEILSDYYCVDLALQSDNIWQTKMLRTKFNEQSYFLHPVDLNDPANQAILKEIRKEMRGIVHMWPE